LSTSALIRLASTENASPPTSPAASHQPRVARDVGRDDGGKAALLGHSGQPIANRPTRQPFAHR
jgi:hypothetical protein